MFVTGLVLRCRQARERDGRWLELYHAGSGCGAVQSRQSVITA